ncbi:MAG: DNA methyltransferase, partial [Pseudomonadota bacterium]
MMRDDNGAWMSVWEGCYDAGWQGDIVAEAFAHPAKFSRGLIHKIYKHAKEMGWVKPGDWVLDPFGGVALGGLDAMSMGLNWIGIELEEKFVKLGQQNIEFWQRQLSGWPNLGTARIMQGDSRRLKDSLCGVSDTIHKIAQPVSRGKSTCVTDMDNFEPGLRQGPSVDRQ